MVITILSKNLAGDLLREWKNLIGHVLAFITRKPYWAMHPDMDLDAMAHNQEALARKVRTSPHNADCQAYEWGPCTCDR